MRSEEDVDSLTRMVPDGQRSPSELPQGGRSLEADEGNVRDYNGGDGALEGGAPATTLPIPRDLLRISWIQRAPRLPLSAGRRFIGFLFGP